MDVLLTIGDFSRMTYLSIKALRHYHDVGLLEPAEVDTASGYRLYDASQVPVAQVIRRFRDLGMPLEEVKAVLEAPDVGSRNEVVVAHLERMEAQLSRDAVDGGVVAGPARATGDSHRRRVPVGPDDVDPGHHRAGDHERSRRMVGGGIRRALRSARRRESSRPGRAGALYPNELFELEEGEVVVFVPVAAEVAPSGRAVPLDIPAAELAITVHEGTFHDIDRAYGALGTYVAQRELGVEGPIRENYLVTYTHTEDESQHRTEVCWPVFQTTPA